MTLTEIITAMKEKGIQFEDGLDDAALQKIQSTYGITFPESLSELYRLALPVSDDDTFPRWDDFSDENVAKIKQRIAAPYEWLSIDIKNGYKLPDLDCDNKALYDDAPTLIPIYSHRYMPSLGTADAPVLSTVGRDTVWYGENLLRYLIKEFIDPSLPIDDSAIPYIPLWSDVISNQ